MSRGVGEGSEANPRGGDRKKGLCPGLQGASCLRGEGSGEWEGDWVVTAETAQSVHGDLRWGKKME